MEAVVYSNPVEGREQEYNDWYSNQHLNDLLAIPGVISARRFKLSGTQIGEWLRLINILRSTTLRPTMCQALSRR